MFRNLTPPHWASVFVPLDNLRVLCTHRLTTKCSSAFLLPSLGIYMPHWHHCEYIHGVKLCIIYCSVS